MINSSKTKKLENVQAFTVPSWVDDQRVTAPVETPSRLNEIQEKALVLDIAKRQAMSSYAKMCSSVEPQHQSAWMAATTRDEQAVLRARIDILNSLMRDPGTVLCIESDKPVRVCATYERLRTDGESELGPMQSTMSWAVYGAEEPIQRLMTCDDYASAVSLLLSRVRASAPRKQALHPLYTLLDLESPERFILKSLSGLNAASDDQTRVAEAVSTGLDGLTYQVVWRALNVDVLEGWQNPSTNSVIRQSILSTAHQATRDTRNAMRENAVVWSNVANIQVRILQGDETHVLSFIPFTDSESCTVSHLQFRQSIFDENGPERGILNLSQDPSSVHPIPLGVILPMRSYACLKAHRNGRLNEAQLNYIHAQGLLAHGHDTSLLPDPATLRWDKAMIPAKATRISCPALDVLASSYHVADQVYTTISVVQYPPFGTQFEKSLGHPLLRATKPGFDIQTGLGVTFGKDVVHNIPNRHGEDGNVYLYSYPRKHRPRLGDNYTEEDVAARRKPWWTAPLKSFQYYFVDGIGPITSSAYDTKYRFILFDMNPDLKRSREMELRAKEIMTSLWNTHNTAWDPRLSFYDNVEKNTNTAPVFFGSVFSYPTIKEEWTRLWKKAIKDEIYHNQQTAPGEPRLLVNKFSGMNFWYTPNESNWEYVIHNKVDRDQYKEFVQECFEHARKTSTFRDILSCAMGQNMNQLKGFPGKVDRIPIPRNRLSSRSSSNGMLQLQSRIHNLEHTLAETRHKENTDHLLGLVLERLDAGELTNC